MDDRRLNTMDILASGLMTKPAPISKVPDGLALAEVEEGDWSEEALSSGLERGGLTASMYYGCWSIWKTGEAFSGELLQYRSITDAFEGQSLEFALDKAIEWASGCS